MLERGEVANSWRRERWDSLRLLTPNWQSRLPGFRYEGLEPDGYMTMGEVTEFIERFAKVSGAPVRTGVNVTSVRLADGGYRLATSSGEIHARTVVIASGACNQPAVPALRDADGPGVDLAAASRQAVSAVGQPHRRDIHAGADRCTRDLGEALDELGHFAHRHVAVRFQPLIAKAGQAALPVGREQPQGVPAFAAPGVRHLAALEHDVIYRPVAEEVACREARVPRSDNDRGEALDGWASQATSTVTSVGFVRASNTAERFTDWATSASMSCRDASASMLNVTLMSL